MTSKSISWNLETDILFGKRLSCVELKNSWATLPTLSRNRILGDTISTKINVWLQVSFDLRRFKRKDPHLIPLLGYPFSVVKSCSVSLSPKAFDSSSQIRLWCQKHLTQRTCHARFHSFCICNLYRSNKSKASDSLSFQGSFDLLSFSRKRKQLILPNEQFIPDPTPSLIL